MAKANGDRARSGRQRRDGALPIGLHLRQDPNATPDGIGDAADAGRHSAVNFRCANPRSPYCGAFK